MSKKYFHRVHFFRSFSRFPKNISNGVLVMGCFLCFITVIIITMLLTLENKKDRVESMGVPNTRSHIRTSPVNIYYIRFGTRNQPYSIKFYIKCLTHLIFSFNRNRLLSFITDKSSVSCVKALLTRFQSRVGLPSFHSTKANPCLKLKLNYAHY